MNAPRLTPEILARLNGDGVTPSWVGDHLGISGRAASKLLRAVGATTGHGGRYFMPGTRPPYVAGKCSRRSEASGSVLETGRDRS